MIKNNRVFLGEDFAFFTITEQDDGMRTYTTERYMSLLFKKYKSNALSFFSYEYQLREENPYLR